MPEEYISAPTFTLVVGSTAVGFSSSQLRPTTGALQGRDMEKAVIQAVGALYIESEGVATSASYPMAAGDALELSHYVNLRKVNFIKKTTDTTVVVIPFYR